MLRQGFAGLTAALALASPAVAADQTVSVTGAASFDKPEVTINAGEKVTWVNNGGFHNVKFEDGQFEVPASPSSSWPPDVSRTFSTANATGYRYYCEAHGGPGGTGMSGKVIVNAPPGTAYTWVGSNNGTWETAANWSPEGIPGTSPADTATISKSDVVVMNGDHTIASLTLSGNGTRAGAGTLTMTGASTWTTGRATGGKNVVAAGGTLTWDTGILNSGELENLGTLTIDSVQFGDGVAGADMAVLDNQGSMTITGPVSDSSEGGARVLNPGTLGISGGNVTLNPAISNTGTVRADGAVLVLTGGTVPPNTGTWTGDPSGTISFAAGTYELEAGSKVDPNVVSVNGTLDLDAGATYSVGFATSVSGTLVLDGPASTILLSLNGGKRGGAGTLAVNSLDAATATGQFTGGTTNFINTESLGKGALSIAEAATVRFPAGFELTGGSHVLDGVLELGGDSVIAPGVLTAGATAVARVLDGGTLALGGLALPRLFSAGTVSLAGGFTGDLVVDAGTFTGAGTISGLLEVNAGTVKPGQLDVGTYDQNGGTLQVGLRSKTDFDAITADLVTLDGGALAADVKYTPATGDEWRVLVAPAEPSGGFATVTPDTVGFKKDGQGGVLFLKPVPEPTVEPTATATASPSPTATAEPSPTATAAPSPTATAAPSPTATPSPTVAPTPAFSTLVKLPKCAKRRAVRVTLLRTGIVRVLLGRKTLKRSAKSFTLRRLPRKAFTLNFEVTLPDGGVVRSRKRFKPCKAS